jgi:multidrug transporter EmrE-like cation transporter
MTTEMTRILMVVGLTAIGVLADTALKLASAQHNPLWNRWSAMGFVLTGAFALVWLFLMRTMKLASVGVLYAVGSALLLVVTGVLFFGERLTPAETAGVVLATMAVVLLGRFGG